VVALKGDGLLGIVGSRPMGLPRYQGFTNTDTVPTAHERTLVVAQLSPDTLPDRWFGLAPYDTLVWNDAPPGLLGFEKAAALREWVQRGGHLVVVLPRVAQSWTDEANNPLFDITPKVKVVRREGVDLAPYALLIAKSKDTQMPTGEVLQTFEPLPGVQADEAICVLAGMEVEGKGRECLVVRRLVGCGMVDLVGLDVASRWMSERALPDPECFWHRILGRRGEFWTAAETQERSQRVNRDGATTVDRDIVGRIAMSGSAATGVFMGLVVFALYWAIAGPLGYAILRRTGQVRHAWLGFVVAAGVFTALAWGGATAIRPGTLKAQHLSIIDHVYSPSLSAVERCRAWISLHVPEYGDATVSVGDPATKAASGFHHALAPWENDEKSGGSFPDARGYRIDARSPDQYTVPTRSTVKQFQVDWAGGSKFKMIHPLPIDGADGPAELRLISGGNRPVLRGILTHDLPGPLQDVAIVVIEGQSDITGWWRNAGFHPALTKRSYAIRLANPWAPGEAIDLAAITQNAATGSASAVWDLNGNKGYLNSLRDLGNIDGQNFDTEESRFWNRLLALTFFQQLDPPDVTPDRGFASRAEPLFQRRFTHGLDLSAYFTQPCVIIVGRLDPGKGGVCPAPLYVSTGGPFHEVKTDGTTMVRWIYPFPANPPVFNTAAANEEPLPAEREAAPDERPPAAPQPRKGRTRR
jgi:hypothetical protein